MKKDTDAVYTDGKWEFDSNVTACFEDMLERSIPQYRCMRAAVLSLTDTFISKYNKFNLLDLGCSNGLGLSEFLYKYKEAGRFLGVDCSEPMLTDAKNKFKSFIDRGNLDFRYMDLRNDFPSETFDIILSELTIMFIPINYRQQIIQNIYNHLNTGGIFFMVEKVLGESAELDNLFVTEYHLFKELNGYTKEQIERKKLSLEGVQVPVTNKWNIELLNQAGFKKVDVFWRWMNFVGYVAIK